MPTLLCDMSLLDILSDILREYPILAVFLPTAWVVTDGDMEPRLETERGVFVGKVGCGWLKGHRADYVKRFLCHLSAHLVCGHHRRGFGLELDERWKVACDLEANHFLYELNPDFFGRLRPLRKKWLGLSAEQIYLELDADMDVSGFVDNHSSWSQLSASADDLVNQSFAANYLDKELFNRIVNIMERILRREITPMQAIGEVFGETRKVAGAMAGGSVVNLSHFMRINVPLKVRDGIEATLVRRRGFSPPEFDFLLLWQYRYNEVSFPFAPRQILICIDTSGSISPQGLAAEASFVYRLVSYLVKCYWMSDICVILADASLQGFWSSRRMEQSLDEFLLRMRGRGGTRIFTSIRQAIDEFGLQPDVVLVLSDFETLDKEDVVGSDVPILGIIVNEMRDEDVILQEKAQKFSRVKFLYSLNLKEVG